MGSEPQGKRRSDQGQVQECGLGVRRLAVEARGIVMPQRDEIRGN